jgi:splicing factor 3B subunit 2
MGKIDIDYQKLHDAFFRFQTKPKMTVHGDLYYEGKEFETRLKEKKPGDLTADLRTALGMPTGVNAHKVPPPWLIAMQRYGPPPSYPNLKIAGLNAPIPDGCSFGYHAGGWGKPPVDEYGRPLYGDVFGLSANKDDLNAEEEVDRTLWGEMDEESEEEVESEEEEEGADEEGQGGKGDDMDISGMQTPIAGGLVTPSGMSSVGGGLETPGMIELRKRRIESEMEEKDNPQLYTILSEKRKDGLARDMMASTHVYDMNAPSGSKKSRTDSGVHVSLDPSDLALDPAEMNARLEGSLRESQGHLAKEDLSDMVAEHVRQSKKPKGKGHEQTQQKQKKYKDFKF